MADGRRKRYSLNVVSSSPSIGSIHSATDTPVRDYASPYGGSCTSPQQSLFLTGSADSLFNDNASKRNSRNSLYRYSYKLSPSLQRSSIGLGISTSTIGLHQSTGIVSSRESLPVSLLEANAPNIKVLFIGDAGVGKTAMILNYCNELPTREQWEHIIGLSPSPNKFNLERRQESNQTTKSNMVRRSMTARIAANYGNSPVNKAAQQKKRYSSTDFDELRVAEQQDCAYHTVKELEGTNELNEFDKDELVLDTRTTIGVDIKTNLINIENRVFNCLLWDTAGQERYRNAIMPSLYKKSNAIVLSYDICDKRSFKNCYQHWLVEAMGVLSAKDYEKARFYLIGNKIDLYKKREVNHSDILAAIDEIERRFGLVIAGNFEVTCKSHDSVNQAMNAIMMDLIENNCYEEKPPSAPTLAEEIDSDDGSNNKPEDLYDDQVSGTSEDEESESEIQPILRQRKPGQISSTTIDITNPNNNDDDNLKLRVSCCT